MLLQDKIDKEVVICVKKWLVLAIKYVSRDMPQQMVQPQKPGLVSISHNTTKQRSTLLSGHEGIAQVANLASILSPKIRPEDKMRWLWLETNKHGSPNPGSRPPCPNKETRFIPFFFLSVFVVLETEYDSLYYQFSVSTFRRTVCRRVHKARGDSANAPTAVQPRKRKRCYMFHQHRWRRKNA